MDENKDNKLQTTGEHSNNLFMKRTLHFLVSICVVFCFILCNSSGLSLFAHSFSFFTHTLERKHVFLICNGILAFLAKSSSSSSPSSSASFSHGSSPPPLSEIKAATLDVEEASEPLKYDAFVAEEAEEDPKEEEPGTENELPTERKGEGMDLGAEHDKEGCTSMYLERQEEQDEGEGEHDEIEEAAAGTEDLKTEELNRKIEEFIRKMKEEIRIEAQRQLIAV